ncbi:hypothetical protein [Cellulomonas composti]|uniref:Uncharacterized protein n=1 Tax=Cellulomonas composti TaxID=266130 RepID=A0A511J9T2_9CELL|nr:hypothetical protein [Cellulomonas composti]GEL94750.1 hypothetical protein CCO02nite_14080 [Cellulomonas composti]
MSEQQHDESARARRQVADILARHDLRAERAPLTLLADLFGPGAPAAAQILAEEETAGDDAAGLPSTGPVTGVPRSLP